MNKDLTSAQKDYATFLPALSGFYATYIGKQRHPDPVKGHILSSFALKDLFLKFSVLIYSP